MKKMLFLGQIAATLLLPSPRRLGPTGTYDLEWLKKQRDKKLNTIRPGELETIAFTELAAHNRRASQMIAAYAVRAERRDGVDATGQSLNGEMTEVDEYGRSRTQTNHRPGEIWLPLRRFQFAAGYTADFFRKRTAGDFVTVLENAQAGHRNRLIREIRDRLFSPFNYDFEDFLVDNKVFNVKALYNNDGTVPPTNANLINFTGGHTHYLGFTQWSADNVRTVIGTVREHSENGRVEFHVAAANEGNVRALPGFAPATDIEVRVSVNETVATRALDTRNPSNRFIGRFDGVDVWVKPWVFDGYGCAIDPDNPPLAIRHPDDAEDEGLRPIGSITTFPLQSDYWGAEFGIGTRRRGGAAVAQFNAPANGTYVDPTGRNW